MKSFGSLDDGAVRMGRLGSEPVRLDYVPLIHSTVRPLCLHTTVRAQVTLE